MVIPFPAAAAAPQPIGILLGRCIGFLEGFEDDSEQCVTPLLTQLRVAQGRDLIALPAPLQGSVRFDEYSGTAYVGQPGTTAFLYSRHDSYIPEWAGYWRWSAMRVDDTGRKWRTGGVAVMDDFGNLVEVSA